MYVYLYKTVMPDNDVWCYCYSVFFEDKYELDALKANTVNRYEPKSSSFKYSLYVGYISI